MKEAIKNFCAENVIEMISEISNNDNYSAEEKENIIKFIIED